MRLAPRHLLPLALLAACTFNTTVNHVDDAPNVPRSSRADVVSVAPKGAVMLGTVTVRGNANMVGAACEAEAVSQAKEMGATHVIVHPVQSSGARGVRCTGDAYFLGSVVKG